MPLQKKTKMILIKIAQIEKLKVKIAKDRDHLRDMVSEIEDLVESIDGGIVEIEEGLRNFQDGLDSLSQYL